MINYVSQQHFSYFQRQISTNMMLHCATSSNVTVCTQVCMAHMTQFPHQAAKLADQLRPKAQGQGTTSYSSAAATTNQYVTGIHSQMRGEGQGSGYCCQVLAAEDYHHHSDIQLIAQDMISAPVSQPFVECLFSVCGLLTIGRCNRISVQATA